MKNFFETFDFGPTLVFGAIILIFIFFMLRTIKIIKRTKRLNKKNMRPQEKQQPPIHQTQRPTSHTTTILKEKEVIKEKEIVVYIRCPYCKAKYPESTSSCPNCGSKD